MVADFDRTKSLQQLEGDDWGEPTYDSYLVKTIHRLRRKPLNEFNEEDLRIVIGQSIGLPYLIPLAVELLEYNPLSAGNYHEGDLLNSVLGVSESFWESHPDLFQRMCVVLARLKNMLSVSDDQNRRIIQDVIQAFTDKFGLSRG